MKEKGIDDVLLTGGGIIPEQDIASLQALGVGQIFHPGTPTHEIAEYIKNWVATHRR
jgi:methylmalonyl-CoA mutase C-terminal domain/subunit